MNKKKKYRWGRMIPVYIMAVPGLIYMICNNYMPLYGALIAFKKLNFQKGILKSEWVGLENFSFLFRSNVAAQIIRNTVLYNVVFIILGMFVSLSLAIFLNEIRSKKLASAYQSVILLPYLMSWVVASYLFYAFLATDTGLINNSILKPLGHEAVRWYSETRWWPFILTFASLWKGVGYQMIIFLANLVSISPEYYEAATVDGATKWQQIRGITLPLLKPTIITLLILAVGHIFASDFGLFYQVPRNTGVLYPVTQTIDVYVYNALMRNSNYGMSSAASLFQSVVGFVLVMITNAIARRTNRDSALF